MLSELPGREQDQRVEAFASTHGEININIDVDLADVDTEIVMNSF